MWPLPMLAFFLPASRVARRFALFPFCRASVRSMDAPSRYAKPGATPRPVVFRRWNTRKNSLRRSNLQLIDGAWFSCLTTIWHKRCSR